MSLHLLWSKLFTTAKDECCKVIILWVWSHFLVSIIKYLWILLLHLINHSTFLQDIPIWWFDFICQVYLVLKHKWGDNALVYFLKSCVLPFYEKFASSYQVCWVLNFHRITINLIFQSMIFLMICWVHPLHTLCDVLDSLIIFLFKIWPRRIFKFMS